MSVRKMSLLGDQEQGQSLPEPKLRIAVATQDGRMLNAHFGSAKRFAVYEVSQDAYRHLETISFEVVSDGTGDHRPDADDRNQAKIDALQGVAVLFVLAIGGPVAARVIQARIHPVKLPSPEPIADVIVRVQGMLGGGERPAWFAKVLKQAGPRNMDFLDDDDL